VPKLRKLTVRVKSSGAELQGVLHKPAEPKGSAVVCHPHPLFGGSMDYPLLEAIAEELASRGIAALRFNFRGVGASTGEYSRGLGEVEDAKNALSYVRKLIRGEAALVGYSFGGSVALAASASAQVACTAAVAPPLRPTMSDIDLEAIAREVRHPVLLVCGEFDSIVPCSDVRRLASMIARCRVASVRDDHFYVAEGLKVASMVAEFVDSYIH